MIRMRTHGAIGAPVAAPSSVPQVGLSAPTCDTIAILGTRKPTGLPIALSYVASSHTATSRLQSGMWPYRSAYRNALSESLRHARRQGRYRTTDDVSPSPLRAPTALSASSLPRCICEAIVHLASRGGIGGVLPAAFWSCQTASVTTDKGP